MKKSILMAAMAAAVMLSCGSSKPAADVAALDGEWNIIEVEGSKINAGDAEEMPFLGFDSKNSNLYGCTGCNRLTGVLKADVKKGTIDFSQTGSTRMMCADMKVERMVLDALGKTTRFSVNGTDKLSLNDNNGKTVIVLQKRK